VGPNFSFVIGLVG